MTAIWKVLEEITSKSTWYSKVFDSQIVGTWFSEFLLCFPQDDKNRLSSVFWTAIQILRLTAQGSKLEDDCNWDDELMCKECRDEIERKIRDKPEDYDVTENDVCGYINFKEYYQDFDDYCKHKMCRCSSPDSQLSQYVLYLPEKSVPDDLRLKFKEEIANMLDNSEIDWHPGSNQQVRDILHQSLYPYIRGVSMLKNGCIEETVNESIRYQWLPSEFNVNENGKIKLASYINNLDDKKFPNVIPCIEQTLESFLPGFESILNSNLRDRSIQVIVKLSSIHLTPDKPDFNGGSWHIEGMPHEYIIASGIHYLTVDGITDSYLEFRKPVVINEDTVDYPQSNYKFTEHHYGIVGHHEGEMNRYLGLIKCSEGASVIFPNFLQHHVKDFSLQNNHTDGTRIIICFFLIDPNHKIISTADIHHQQAESDFQPKSQIIFTKEEANYHRDRLMYHRKYFVDSLNKKVYERSYSLCEH